MRLPRAAARVRRTVGRSWRRFNALYDELFFVPYRAALRRHARDKEDLFVLLCFSDLIGVPNPASYYTLELLPEMLERFHDWHRRQGMDRSPLDGFRCC